MNVGYLHGYRIETVDALRFWSSDHRCNRAKAIIAFSKDLKEANDNLRRMGYRNLYRKRAITALGLYVNNPRMSSIPFSTCAEKWWECMFQYPGKGAFVKWTLDMDIDGHWARAYFNDGDYLYVGSSGTVDGKSLLKSGHIYQYKGKNVSGVPFNDVIKNLVDKGVFDPSAEVYNIRGSSELEEFFKWFDPDRWDGDLVWKEA